MPYVFTHYSLFSIFFSEFDMSCYLSSGSVLYSFTCNHVMYDVQCRQLAVCHFSKCQISVYFHKCEWKKAV